MRRAGPWLGGLALAVLFVLRHASILAHLDAHFVDFAPLHGGQLLNEVADTRLNSWILAWVRHAVAERPASLVDGSIFDANIHHPARDTLAGSEHLFGVVAQLAPVLPFTDSAVALHQAALALSTALLMATTAFAVRWMTGSTWAALVAAAFALGMPWRVTELSHLQLSSVQLLPFVWTGVVRGLLGEARARHHALLGLAVALQLLSSFYLAYFLSLSCAVLVALVACVHRPRLRDVAALAAAVAPGYLLLVLSALPYLARQASADLASQYDPSFSLGIGGAFSIVAPRWPHWPAHWRLANEPASYWTPWGVALLAVVGAVSALRARARAPRLFATALALVGIVATSFVMMIGGSLEVAGVRVPLPSMLLGEVIPGFSLLRGPPRWGILACVALPMLAGAGVAAIDARVARALALAPMRTGASAAARIGARAAVALASAATFAWFAIPTVPAWGDPALVAARYGPVRALPALPSLAEGGALLEIPWPVGHANIEYGSRAVLMSTLHWRPVLNGYTGHRPPTYRFLQRIGARLPDRGALDALADLTRLRWVLVDLDRASPLERRAWLAAERKRDVRALHRDAHTVLYEVDGWQTGGGAMEALLATEPRPTTLAGLPRTPLALPAPAGAIDGRIAPRQAASGLYDTWLRVRNDSDVAWPGFDLDPRGLVQARYTFAPTGAGDAPAVTKLAPIDQDVAAHAEQALLVFLEAPRRAGEYALCIDLVQRRYDGIAPLPVAPLRRAVAVERAGEETEIGRLIEKAMLRAAPIAPCGAEARE